MSSTEDTFYEGKRPWSIVKDQVLGGYIPPFTRKVAKLRRPILLIDAFAGPGVYEDGKSGSPLIICKAATGVEAEWQAVFINRHRGHHEKLTSVIEKAGWADNARTLLGDSSQQLGEIRNSLVGETIFLYLDPFGLSGCDFGIIRSYIERALAGHSVEVVVNMSMPTLHRLAASQAVAEGKRDDAQIAGMHRTLSRALGGSWWQEIMWTSDDPSQKEEAIMRRYTRLLADYLPYTGFCPVREDSTADVKYYITFASGHPDGLILMNDIMLKAYEQYIFRAEAGPQRTLWGWEAGRNLSGLADVILNTIGRSPNCPRHEVWSLIVRANFMTWMQKEFRATLTELAKQGRVNYPPDPETGRRNKNSCLTLTE